MVTVTVPERLIRDEAAVAGVTESQKLPDLSLFILRDAAKFTEDVSHVGFGKLQTITQQKCSSLAKEKIT